MIFEKEIIMANLDKRQRVSIPCMPAVTAAANIVKVTLRAQQHDAYASRQSKKQLEAHMRLTGFFALVSPRSELDFLTTVEEQKHHEHYGSWYGDRIICYSSTGNGYNSNQNAGNPFQSNTNVFIDVSHSLIPMGREILKQTQIMVE
jgi:hypothetical protein